MIKTKKKERKKKEEGKKKKSHKNRLPLSFSRVDLMTEGVNENLYMAHKKLCTKPCVFTAPYAHNAHK